MGEEGRQDRAPTPFSKIETREHHPMAALAEGGKRHLKIGQILNPTNVEGYIFLRR